MRRESVWLGSQPWSTTTALSWAAPIAANATDAVTALAAARRELGYTTDLSFIPLEGWEFVMSADMVGATAALTKIKRRRDDIGVLRSSVLLQALAKLRLQIE